MTRLPSAIASAFLIVACGSGPDEGAVPSQAEAVVTPGHDYCAAIREALAVAQARQNALVPQIDALRQQHADLTTQARPIEAQIPPLELTVSNLGSLISTIENSSFPNDSRLPGLVAQLSSARAQLAQLEAQFAALKSRLASIDAQLLALVRQAAEYSQQIFDLEGRLGSCSITVKPR